VIHGARDARAGGIAVVHGGVFPEASAIAKLAGYELDGRPLVVSIAGPEARIRANQQYLTDLIAKVFNNHNAL
jgi:hypothetical protein